MSEKSLQSELRAELKDAMRARDSRRLDVIRLIETEVSKALSAPGFRGEADDQLYQREINAYAKKMQKARKEYEKVGNRGAEMIEKLDFELDYLQRWLPSKLDEPQTLALVREAIAELGVGDAKQAGRVVGHLMKKHGADIDGAVVNRLVRAALAQ